MPARFINVSGTGGARFINLSGTGRANFSGGGGITTSTTTTTTTNNLQNISVRLNTVTGATLCSTGTVNRLVDGGVLAEGSVLYLANGTTPVTGFTYVVDGAGGFIYNLDSVTGVIGSNTGQAC